MYLPSYLGNEINSYETLHIKQIGFCSLRFRTDLCLLKIRGKLPDCKRINWFNLWVRGIWITALCCFTVEAHADDNNEAINAQWDTTTLGTSVLLCKDSTGLGQAAPVRETNNIHKDAASCPLRLTSLSTRSSYTNRKVTESYHGGVLKGQLGPLLLLKQNHFCEVASLAWWPPRRPRADRCRWRPVRPIMVCSERQPGAEPGSEIQE